MDVVPSSPLSGRFVEIGHVTNPISQLVVPKSLFPVNFFFDEKLFERRLEHHDILSSRLTIFCLKAGVEPLFNVFDVFG